jgi:O-antigen ligase
VLFAPIIVLVALTQGASTYNLSNSDSMTMRVEGWVSSWETYSSASLIEKLFGIGMVPYIDRARTEMPSKVSSSSIDNVLLIVLLYVGVVGLLLLAFIFVRAWRFIYERATSSRSHLQTAVAAFWSTALLAGMFNYTLAVFSILLIVSEIAEPGVERDVTLSYNRSMGPPHHAGWQRS